MTHNLRRKARERALQLLFLLEKNPTDDPETAFRLFWEQQSQLQLEQEGTIGEKPGVDSAVDERLRAFAEHLAAGVLRHKSQIDARLIAYLQNWRIERLGGIERNVLRLALYELFYDQDVPPVVCINEAVDLAKYFSATGSGRFVNGILDRAGRDVPRHPRRDPSRAPAGRFEEPPSGPADSASDSNPATH